MYLYSKNGSRVSNTLEDNRKNIDQFDGSMKVEAQQEDLQFLAQILQEQLLAEVPSGEFFQVKCAVKNDQLMILAQHPLAVQCNTETIFTVLEEALQSLPEHHEQQVELFLRVFGQKLPYAKRLLSLRVDLTNGVDQASGAGGSTGEGGAGGVGATASTYLASPVYPVKAILVGAALMVIAVFGGGAYFLTRSCVTFECKKVQTAKQLQWSLGQMKLSFKSEKELPKIQQQLDAASTSLKTIPPWSPHYQEAEKLSASLSGKSQKIQQVRKAFRAGSIAAQKSQTPANSLQELEARLQLWRVAIAPLEAINSNSELYKLVQPKLLIYRTNLQAVRLQLLAEEKWLKKLTAAKAVAIAATKREASAQSLEDLQKVQSTWQVAINTLANIPRSSTAYQDAQKLLVEYKPFLAAARDRATLEILAAKTYNLAINAANLAKRYEQQNQWLAAVTHWNQALNAARQVTRDTMYYSQAQTLIAPYSTALNQAQEKLQVANLFQKIRTDLEKTCDSRIRFCHYTIGNHDITVQLTPEYEQMLQSSLTANNQGDPHTVVNVTNHLQTLQQALEVISDNANLPLILYDVQGRAIHTHTPRG